MSSSSPPRRSPPDPPVVAGVRPVLAVPFDPDGAVDYDSLSREIDFVIELGVDGVVLFGLGSEVYKLVDAERRAICAHVVRRVEGRVPVVVGAEHTGTEGAVARAREAADLGGAALMLYPPAFVKPDAAGVIEYFRAVSDSVALPIVVQDAQAWTNVSLPVPLLLDIAAAAPRVESVKIETPPTGAKITALLQQGGGSPAAIGGYGGIYFLDEMVRGAVGAFIGCAMPDLFLAVRQALAAGDRDAAARIFHHYLPLLVCALTSLDAFNEIQKRLLQRAGVFRHAVMRRPHVPVDRAQWQYLDDLLRERPLKVTGGVVS